LDLLQNIIQVKALCCVPENNFFLQLFLKETFGLLGKRLLYEKRLLSEKKLLSNPVRGN